MTARTRARSTATTARSDQSADGRKLTTAGSCQHPGARASPRAAAASSPHRMAGRRCCRGRRVRRPPRSPDPRGPASPPPRSSPSAASSQVGTGHELVPPARVTARSPRPACGSRSPRPAHTRSRTACSSHHLARETRARTRRSRRPASARSLIVTRPSCQPRSENWTLSGCWRVRCYCHPKYVSEVSAGRVAAALPPGQE